MLFKINLQCIIVYVLVSIFSYPPYFCSFVASVFVEWSFCSLDTLIRCVVRLTTDNTLTEKRRQVEVVLLDCFIR